MQPFEVCIFDPLGGDNAQVDFRILNKGIVASTTGRAVKSSYLDVAITLSHCVLPLVYVKISALLKSLLLP